MGVTLSVFTISCLWETHLYQRDSMWLTWVGCLHVKSISPVYGTHLCKKTSVHPRLRLVAGLLAAERPKSIFFSSRLNLSSWSRWRPESKLIEDIWILGLEPNWKKKKKNNNFFYEQRFSLLCFMAATVPVCHIIVISTHNGNYLKSVSHWGLQQSTVCSVVIYFFSHQSL